MPAAPAPHRSTGVIDPQERFRLLYESHAGRVLSYAARRAGAHDAPEVVAETFLVAWRRIDEVPEDAVPWLFATARNCLLNRRRSQRRVVRLMERMSLQRPTGGDPAGVAEETVPHPRRAAVPSGARPRASDARGVGRSRRSAGRGGDRLHSGRFLRPSAPGSEALREGPPARRSRPKSFSPGR